MDIAARKKSAAAAPTPPGAAARGFRQDPAAPPIGMSRRSEQPEPTVRPGIIVGTVHFGGRRSSIRYRRLGALPQRRCSVGSIPTQGSVQLRTLEGRRVSLSLTNGSQLDSVEVISAGRGGLSSLWLEVDGIDLFVEKAEILAIHEVRVGQAA